MNWDLLRMIFRCISPCTNFTSVYSMSAKVNGYEEMFKPISGLFEYMYLKNGQT